MILAGNEEIHKSLDEFEFGQDLETDYGVDLAMDEVKRPIQRCGIEW